MEQLSDCSKQTKVFCLNFSVSYLYKDFSILDKKHKKFALEAV